MATCEIRIPSGQHFNLQVTLKCGQGHRWLEDGDWFTGVFGHDFVRIRQEKKDEPLQYACVIERQSAIEDQLRHQFRLDDNIEDIYTDLSNRDAAMAELVQQYPGLRVMQVDPWECLVFFIMSNNSSVQGIHLRMEKLANAFGADVPNTQRKTFPSDTVLETKTPHEVEELGLGFNSWLPKLILETAHSRLRGRLSTIEQVCYVKAVNELSKLQHVGDKVANCIALFSLEHLNAFPVDRHIRKASENLYGGTPTFPAQSPKSSYDGRILDWAQVKFDPYAGYASQFLFVDQLKHRQSTRRHNPAPTS